jgi:DNA processing protein
MLLKPQDVLEGLDLTHNVERREIRKALPADDTEAALLIALGAEPVHVDEIRNQTGLPIEKVSAALTMMELKGMVRQVGGMNYVAVRDVSGEYHA